jgi:hypothetical protein
MTRAASGLCLIVSTAAAAGCRNGLPLALTQQVEARRLASTIRVQFSKAAEASNRAVMEVTDEASTAAAREAEEATQAVERDLTTLERILGELAYRDESQQLQTFKACFGGYRALDADILPLAVENTNIKAQRLSFGPARDAAIAFRQALEAAGQSSAAKNACCVEAPIRRAVAAVLEVQVIEARHIAESDEAAMSQMERDMATSEGVARQSLDDLKQLLASTARPHLDAATAALDRFKAINGELVALSRRNSNVRSLALSLGKKRTVTAECDAVLQGLEGALSKRGFPATR